jgi:hypothetical protein
MREAGPGVRALVRRHAAGARLTSAIAGVAADTPERHINQPSETR